MAIRRLVLFTALAMASPVAAQPSDEAALRRLNDVWLGAYAAKDGDALEKLLGDDFVFVRASSGERLGKAKIVSDVRAGTFNIERCNWRDVVVTVFQRSALVTGINRCTTKGGDARSNRYFDVYEKRDGRWYAVAAQNVAIEGQ